MTKVGSWPISSKTFIPKRFPNTGHNAVCVTTHMPIGDVRKYTWKFALGSRVRPAMTSWTRPALSNLIRPVMANTSASRQNGIALIATRYQRQANRQNLPPSGPSQIRIERGQTTQLRHSAPTQVVIGALCSMSHLKRWPVFSATVKVHCRAADFLSELGAASGTRVDVRRFRSLREVRSQSVRKNGMLRG